ncbi:hypothetical protein AB6A40_006717 [Gnathostoma spinigerum]|uniref:Uncharacterized protein n=1 Tax=Gnathostoma spinigerum TaxID=75299 RepID=A0ABD6ESK2_9BILA
MCATLWWRPEVVSAGFIVTGGRMGDAVLFSGPELVSKNHTVRSMHQILPSDFCAHCCSENSVWCGFCRQAVSSSKKNRNEYQRALDIVSAVTARCVVGEHAGVLGISININNKLNPVPSVAAARATNASSVTLVAFRHAV